MFTALRLSQWSQCVFITGTEATYADLGHFSRPAIRVSAEYCSVLIHMSAVHVTLTVFSTQLWLALTVAVNADFNLCDLECLLMSSRRYCHCQL